MDSSTFSILTLIGSQHIDLCMSTFSVTIVDLILQICLLDLLWIRPLISLDVYCGLLLVGNAIKCYLNLLAVCFVRALLSSYLFFRFRSAMPPRHSKRTYATSSEAITVAAATEPTRQKSRDSSRPALATSVEQWTDQQPSSSPLPPDLMDQLVSWIVQEVTCVGHTFHLKFTRGTR